MKICVATGTRAEYGLLKPLITALDSDSQFDLQLLVTGAHLSPEFDLTYKAIEKEFKIDQKVEMLLSADTPSAIVKSMGVGMISYADAFNNLQPDVLVILGDRYEMLALASSALIFNIQIAHIHGGEVTEGAYDDAIRHSITKMSHLHFASTEEYKNRIIQLGENPENVYNVGAIGLDNIRNIKLLSKEELENDLNIKFRQHNYQVTFHPSTLDDELPEFQFQKLLNAIDAQEDSYFIFTKSNADTGGRIINKMIDDFVAANPDKASAYDTLGSLKFLSVVKVCDAIVGNSSSGILEAPSLHTATINIGLRQKGRIQAESIINVEVDEEKIKSAFEKVKSTEYKEIVNSAVNPYGDGNTTEKIMKVLRHLTPEKLKVKSFFDFKC